MERRVSVDKMNTRGGYIAATKVLVVSRHTRGEISFESECCCQIVLLAAF